MLREAKSCPTTLAKENSFSVNSEFIISSGILFLAENARSPRNIGSIPPSSIILCGEKNAWCNGKLPSLIGWKLSFSLNMIG
jgi:hypothetical protein